MNVIVRQEFELAYYDFAVQHVSHEESPFVEIDKMTNINKYLYQTFEQKKIWNEECFLEKEINENLCKKIIYCLN